MAYAVDNGPVQHWRPGDPPPAVFFEAAADPSWVAVAHGDQFERAIEQCVLAPRYNFPIVPPERHRCTMAMCLALGLPAKLGAAADVLELAHRKDAAGERLMRQMSKPRKRRKDEDPAGAYWHDDRRAAAAARQLLCARLRSRARAVLPRCPRCRLQNRRCGRSSHRINERGFHVDLQFAEAARRIAQAAAPEIDAELAELTGGAVTGINRSRGCCSGCKRRAIDAVQARPQYRSRTCSTRKIFPPLSVACWSSGSAVPRLRPKNSTRSLTAPVTTAACVAPSSTTAPPLAAGPEKAFSHRI